MSTTRDRRLEAAEDLLIEIADALCKLLNPALPSTPEVYADGLEHGVEQLQKAQEADMKQIARGCQLCGCRDGTCAHVRAQRGPVQ
jgi:hypothetical protein